MCLHVVTAGNTGSGVARVLA